MIERSLYLKQLIKYKDKDIIKVITGVRRCGKSVLLFNIYANYLIDNGVDTSNIIKVNLENIDNANLRESLNLYEYIKGKIVNDKNIIYLILALEIANYNLGIWK